MKVLAKGLEVEDCFGRNHLSALNSKLFVGKLSSHMKIFFPERLWLLINQIINKNMVSKLTTSSMKSTAKYHKSELKLEETPAFLSLCWDIEFNSSKKNSTLDQVFRDLKNDNNGNLLFGLNRFKALRSCLIPDQEDLIEAIKIFRASWSNAIKPGSIICFDEALWDFRPNKNTKEEAEKRKDPIPVVFIPRKPHPNGLLCYFMGMKMFNTNLPYVFDLEPHISFPQVPPQQALRNCIERWQYPYKPHIVADSAFGSLNLASEISDWGIK